MGVPSALKQDLAGHAQAVHPGVDGAEPVGEHLREHGDDPVREVDRVAALEGLAVQGAVGLDIGRDVGDADQELPALGGRLAVDGVVEVPGIGPVDGHQWELAQVGPPRLGSLRDLLRQGRDLRQDIGRPIHRQVVGADGDIRLHPRGHVVAQDLDDAPDGLGPFGGLVGDLRHHDLPRLGLADQVAGDDDLVSQALVVGHHEPDAALLVEAPDHAVGLALQNFDDPSLQAPAPVPPCDPHHHAVAMEEAAHFLRIEIQVVAAGIGLDEAEAVRVADDPPGDEIAAVDQAEGIDAVSHQLAVADHGREAPIEGGEVFVGG